MPNYRRVKIPRSQAPAWERILTLPSGSLGARQHSKFSRESSSSRSGDPAFKKLESRAGSPLREDDDSLF